MLSVPTLWTVLVINFLSLGLIWAYVQRTYPSFEAARYWTGSAFMCATAAAVAMLRGIFDESLLPLLAAGTIMVLATCLATMGIQCFYEKRVDWNRTAIITMTAFAGMWFFIYVNDSAPARLTIFTVAQALPLVLSLKMLLSPPDGRKNAGAQLAGIVVILIVTIYSLRLMAGLSGAAGGFSFTHYGQFQSLLTLTLVFLSMAVNFGFLLMAIDRLRSEVADLALMDDLTGVANRRHLLQRLTEECARSERSDDPFSLLVIDLDGFKSINDTHGHAAGDACLQHFTLMAQTRLRPGDLLARAGGDEFSIVLPSSTLREAVLIARRLLEVCRADAAECAGTDIPISVSIGVAQWTRAMGAFPDRLIAAADHALYEAKRDGRNRFAAYDPSPPLVPSPERDSVAEVLRKHA
jgi:diguanylate cyclase (GGDEF)-like protein